MVAVASIYLLGMLIDKPSTEIFTRILGDDTELPRCREYAAEALGYVCDPKTRPLIEHVYAATTSDEIRESCQFALRQIPISRSR